MIKPIPRRLGFAPFAALLLFWAPAWAINLDSPVGLWRTIDDNTGKPRAIIRIFEQGGRLYGVVMQVLDPRDAGKMCEKCTDDRRGKPVLGLDIIRGLVRDGDHWGGGTILDPENGKTYRCRLTLRSGGERLAVRGFLGIALLGRTQVWQRVN